MEYQKVGNKEKVRQIGPTRVGLPILSLYQYKQSLLLLLYKFRIKTYEVIKS